MDKGRLSFVFGRGEDGQLGLGDTEDQDAPVLVEALQGKPVVSIACGSGHTLVTLEDGVIYTWGRGDDGRLGHGDQGWKYVPRAVQALSGKRTVQATCGSYHTAAVTDQGELYTWGGGMYGKLGHGNESGHSIPWRVEYLVNKGIIVSQVACGSRHTCIVSTEGEVYSWGDKENGVVGHNDCEGHQYLPRVIETLGGKIVRQVAACGFHTAAVTEAGEVYSWGEGKFGRLGHGTERNQLAPKAVEALLGQRVLHVACGGFHSAAITERGLYTWGGGEHGQLGHGDKVNKHTPCLVEALERRVATQVTCGWSHTVALCEGGRVYTWGNGDHGKLGHGDTLKVTLPRLVESLSAVHVIKVASYNEHTAVLVEPSGGSGTVSLSSSFVVDLGRLVNGEFNDVTFVVEGQPVRAHKAFLAVRCEHFRAMFSSGMQESHQDQANQSIVIPNIRLPIFMAFLHYIYTDTLCQGIEEAIELYMLADLYMCEGLKTMCVEVVSKCINTENAAHLLQLSEDMRASEIRTLCLGFIVRYSVILLLCLLVW
ncbi:unnamed protein product [Chrysoparadoxa australica]